MARKYLLPLVLMSAICVMAAIRSVSLIDAIERGDHDAVRKLLANNSVDVNVISPDGSTALQWAASRGDIESVDLLLKAKADVKIANRFGATALSLAAEKGSAPIIESLLSAGADANAVLPGGETVLMAAARNGNAPAVRRLLAHGADVKARDARGQTALMWAAARNNADAIRMLVEFGSDINRRTSRPIPPTHKSSDAIDFGPAGTTEMLFFSPPPTSFSPFQFAVRAGAVDAAKALLEAGANVNDTLSDGETALVVAVANGHWELADFLLEKGADPNLAGAGWNALHQTMLTRRQTVSFGTPPPPPHGTEDSIEVVKKMIEHGANVNARMTRNMRDGHRNRLNRLGATAFLLAAKGGDIEAMRVLVAAGADPKMPNVDGTTPLMVAAGVKIWNPGEDGGSLESEEGEVLQAVRLCVELGNDVNAKNSEGETALHGAAYRGVNSIVQYLVDKGARLDVKDIHGLTPLAIATGVNYSDFFHIQQPTADLLSKLMKERGLSTEGQFVGVNLCVDCLQTHADQIRAWLERDEKQEAEFNGKTSAPSN